MNKVDDVDRDAFEKWFEADRFLAESDWFKRDKEDVDDYFNSNTSVAWAGWQAALAYARDAASEETRIRVARVICETEGGNWEMDINIYMHQADAVIAAMKP